MVYSPGCVLYWFDTLPIFQRKVWCKINIETVNILRNLRSDLIAMQIIEANKASGEGDAFSAGRSSSFFQAAQMVDTLLTKDDKEQEFSLEDKCYLDKSDEKYDERKER